MNNLMKVMFFYTMFQTFDRDCKNKYEFKKHNFITKWEFLSQHFFTIL